MRLFRVNNDKSPVVRIMILLISAGVLWAGMRYILQYSGSSSAVNLRLAAKYVHSEPSLDGGDPFAKVQGINALPPDTEEEIVEIERDASPSPLISLRPVLKHIFSWLPNADTGNQGIWGRAQWHGVNLLREPDYWRFERMHVFGELVSSEIIDFPDNPQGLQKLFWLTLYDRHEHYYYSVLTPTMPEGVVVAGSSKSLKQGGAGSMLAFDGVYLMNFPYTTASGVTQAPLFVTKVVYPASEGFTPAPLLDGASARYPHSEKSYQPEFETIPGIDIEYIKSRTYSPAKTGDMNPQYRSMAADLRSEKDVLRHIFQYLYGSSDKQISQRVANSSISYVDLMSGANAPAWSVGKFCGFEGVAFSQDTLHFSGAKDGIKRIYLLTAGDLKYTNVADFTWVVACLELPKGLRRGDRIRAEGIFLKLYPYKTRDNYWHWAPLILCKKIIVLPQPLSLLAPEWLTRENAKWFFAAAGFVIIALFIYMYGSSKNDTRILNRILLRSRRKHNESTNEGAPDNIQDHGDR